MATKPSDGESQPQEAGGNPRSEHANLLAAYEFGLLHHEAQSCVETACLMPEESMIAQAALLLERLSVACRNVAPDRYRDQFTSMFGEHAKDLSRILYSEDFHEEQWLEAERVQAEGSTEQAREKACNWLLRFVRRTTPGLRNALAECSGPAVEKAIRLGEIVDQALRPEPTCQYIFDPALAAKLPEEAPSAKYLANKPPPPGTVPLPACWLDLLQQVWHELCMALNGKAAGELHLDPAWGDLTPEVARDKVDLTLRQTLGQLGMAPPETADQARYIFRPKGHEKAVWEIRFDGEEDMVIGVDGFEYIRTLLQQPNVLIPAGDLWGADTRSDVEFGGQEVYDEEYRCNLERKIQKLENQIEDEKEFGHDVTALEEQRKQLQKTLLELKGFRGKQPTIKQGIRSKARENVRQVVYRARNDLAKHMPNLFDHLRKYLHVGYECFYSPDTNYEWQTD